MLLLLLIFAIALLIASRIDIKRLKADLEWKFRGQPINGLNSFCGEKIVVKSVFFENPNQAHVLFVHRGQMKYAELPTRKAAHLKEGTEYSVIMELVGPPDLCETEQQIALS